jgi:enterochelin esterase-like enzyme
MKSLIFFLCLSLCGLDLYSQNGQIISTDIIESEILGRQLEYSIYLPPNYESSEKFYPILYLLHGAWDNHLGWVSWGDLLNIADKTFTALESTEMIIVMPDGLSDTFYQNNYDGSIRYEDFFVHEFIPFVESKYRSVTTEQSESTTPMRAIAGQSMGGYGALYLTLKHPSLFRAVYTSSAGFIDLPRLYNKPFDAEVLDSAFLKIWGPKQKDGSFKNFRSNSIQEMISLLNSEQISKLPPIFIECGDDDYLLDGNLEVSQALKTKGADIEFRVFNGGHTTDYWRDKVDDILIFTGKYFLK